MSTCSIRHRLFWLIGTTEQKAEGDWRHCSLSLMLSLPSPGHYICVRASDGCLPLAPLRQHGIAQWGLNLWALGIKNRILFLDTHAHTHIYFASFAAFLPLQHCHTLPVQILGKDTVSGFRFMKTRQCNQFLYDSASDAFITREHQSQGTGSTSYLWHFPPPGTVHAIHRMPVSKMSLPGNCMHHYYQMSNLRAGKKTQKEVSGKKNRPYFKMLHLIEAVWFTYMTTVGSSLALVTFHWLPF